MKIIVLFARIFTGLLFIVSGLIKANDALGFSYKLEEYFDVFGMAWMDSLALAFSIFICVLEVVLGVAVILGTKIKPVSWALLLLIVFFTFLTFYSAYFNKVTDCGCFGDALKLTPWESFTKDIILLVFILIIFFNRNSIKSVFKTAKADWIATGLSTIAITSFSLYCLWHLPVKDFRPYAIGKSIPEQMKLPEGAKPDIYETKLIYKNTSSGEVKEFSSADYPWQDSTWVWQETQNKLIQKGDEAEIHDFKIMDYDGNDYTADFLSDPDYIFILISYDINKTNKEAHIEFNEFAKECLNNGVSIIGLTASSYNTVENFRHEVQSMYDYYNADEITLKTIIRASPGLILLKEGVVIGQWHYNDIPSFEEVKAKYLN